MRMRIMQNITKINLFHWFFLCNYSILLRFIFLFWHSLKQKLLSSEARRLIDYYCCNHGFVKDLQWCNWRPTAANMMSSCGFTQSLYKVKLLERIIWDFIDYYFRNYGFENRPSRDALDDLLQHTWCQKVRM